MHETLSNPNNNGYCDCCRSAVAVCGCHTLTHYPLMLSACSAEPIIAEAEAALNSLDKGSLGELKSFGSPAAEIVQVRGDSTMCISAAEPLPHDCSQSVGMQAP